MKKLYLAVLLFIGTINLFGQRAADKVLEFENKVEDLIIVPFNGIVAISDGQNLNGYDPSSDDQIWTTHIPKQSATSIIANTDLSADAILSSNIDFM